MRDMRDLKWSNAEKKIGLLISRLSGLAALGLAGMMVGATITSLFIIDAGLATITPVILFVLNCFIAWGRRPQTKTLAGRLER